MQCWPLDAGKELIFPNFPPYRHTRMLCHPHIGFYLAQVAACPACRSIDPTSLRPTHQSQSLSATRLSKERCFSNRLARSNSFQHGNFRPCERIALHHILVFLHFGNGADAIQDPRRNSANSSVGRRTHKRKKKIAAESIKKCAMRKNICFTLYFVHRRTQKKTENRRQKIF